MKISTLIIAFILFFHAAELKTLDTSEFSIKYPDNWTVDQNGLSGTKFILYSPAIDGQAFRNNTNLIIQDLTGYNLDLDAFVKLSVDQIKQYIPAANIISSKTENGRHQIIYTGTHEQLKLKWKQYYRVQNNRAYVLTFTADQASFDENLELATQVMDSFIIK